MITGGASRNRTRLTGASGGEVSRVAERRRSLPLGPLLLGLVEVLDLVAVEPIDLVPHGPVARRSCGGLDQLPERHPLAQLMHRHLLTGAAQRFMAQDNAGGGIVDVGGRQTA